VDGLINIFRNFRPMQLIMLVATLAACLAFFYFVGQRVLAPPLTLLYGELSLEESGQIVGRLEAAKVPFELRQQGSQILVPTDQVTRLRMQLAENGLPSGGSVGYEIFDRSNSLGATSFVQNINHLRALEGELARSIKTLQGVQSARVHLVMPHRELFARETPQPSASIVINSRGGKIEHAQVRAIQNLVAAAVAGLKPSHIAVIDEQGTLLASGEQSGDAASDSANGLTSLRVAQEQRIKTAIESLLEPSVGRGNVRAEVNADLDFDRLTVNSESFDPDGQVTRSTQTVTEENQGSEGQSSKAVTVTSNLPADESDAAGSESSNRSQRTEELVNFEISKTIKTQTREAGVLRRLSVAVAVNGAEGKDAEGKPTFTPRTDEEIARFTALVRSAVGFDKARGDTVEVVGVRFAKIEIEAADPAAAEESMFDFAKEDIFRISEIIVLGLISLLAMLFVVRPLLGRLMEAARIQPPGSRPAQLQNMSSGASLTPYPQGALSTPQQDETPMFNLPRSNIDQAIDVARVEGQVKATSMKKIGEIIDKHPEEAVAIVRSWLYQPS
jgi:flagellar M-ring protein FliF